MKYLSPIVLMLVTGVGLSAQSQEHAGHPEYANFADRTIKALAPEEVDGYRQGAGMGMAAAAELNGYPGPKHVLELQDKLDLTAEQHRLIRRLNNRMYKEAVALGETILQEEQTLDSLYAGGTITVEVLDSLVRRIGELKGELRSVHLSAHLGVREALTPEQVHRYNILRGYAGKATQQPMQHEH